MARKKTSNVRVNVKASLSRRLKEIRQELFGEHGGPELARRLNLPARTWYNYETGVTVPAEILLGFIEQTGANPLWLLTGEGSVYRAAGDDKLLAELTPIQLIRRGLEKLEQEPGDVTIVAPDSLPSDEVSEFFAVSLIPLETLANPNFRGSDTHEHVLAYRKWLPHPRETVGVRLTDDSMSPVLPAGSVVAIDRAVTDPGVLQGRMVAAQVNGTSMIRWLDLSGRHMILRPNHMTREFPLIPVEVDAGSTGPIIGQVVWSWSRFNGS